MAAALEPAAHLERVLQAYEQWAPTYDTVANETRDLDERLLRSWLESVEPGDVLEPGCGTGKNTRWLSEAGRVRALDVSPAMLDRCRRAAPDADVQIADLTVIWPVDAASIDTVVLSLVLEHIADLGHVARECARVLRPGGRVRISEFHPLRQQAGDGARFEVDGRTVSVPSCRHTTAAIVSAFEAVGLVVDAMRDHWAGGDRTDGPPRLLVLELRR